MSKKKFVTKLNNLKGKNPKLYWKLLQGNKKDSIKVPLEAFKKHFEELSVEAADTNSNNPFPEFDVRDLNTSSLNQPFSEQEIRKFVKNLKNNKAAGINEIINEYIKSSIDLMLPIYIKLFNRVLHTG